MWFFPRWSNLRAVGVRITLAFLMLRAYKGVIEESSSSRQMLCILENLDTIAISPDTPMPISIFFDFTILQSLSRWKMLVRYLRVNCFLSTQCVVCAFISLCRLMSENNFEGTIPTQIGLAPLRHMLV